jgi:hypothetical protein
MKNYLLFSLCLSAGSMLGSSLHRPTTPEELVTPEASTTPELPAIYDQLILEQPTTPEQPEVNALEGALENRPIGIMSELHAMTQDIETCKRAIISRNGITDAAEQVFMLLSRLEDISLQLHHEYRNHRAFVATHKKTLEKLRDEYITVITNGIGVINKSIASGLPLSSLYQQQNDLTGDINVLNTWLSHDASYAETLNFLNAGIQNARAAIQARAAGR